jgi:nitrogen fixation negative regulator NifL
MTKYDANDEIGQTMNTTKQTIASENIIEAIEAFLKSPPVGIPDTVIETFNDMVDKGANMLPPRIFFEAVEQSSIAISITDINANILYTNAAFERITGYNNNEIIGQNQAIFSNHTTPRIVYETLWGRIKQQKSWAGTLVNRRKDGTRYVAELTIAPVVNANKKTSYYLGIHRDVTDVHRLEQQVSHQKLLIESVVDTAPIIIALLDRTGKVILDNMEYKKLAADMGGKEPASEFVLALKGTMGAEFNKSWDAGKEFKNEEISFDPGSKGQPRCFQCTGTWINELDVSAKSFFDERRETYLLLSINEITNLKKQQEEVRTNALRALMAEEELTQSVREALTGSVYQIQGPINLISAAMSMLERRSIGQQNNDNEAVMNALQQAITAGQEAMNTMQSCIPKTIEEPFEMVNLNRILREVLSISTERLLKSGILIDWKPSPMLPSILGKERRLRSMFKQLIDNAIDSISDFANGEGVLKIITRTSGTNLEVTIEDNGVGIPEDIRVKIFEPFFTTKKRMSGRAGMGLSMVLDVINEHSGAIEIDSEVTNGCRINVQLSVQPQ